MSWWPHAFLYHLYPLGALGAPARNDFHSVPVDRLAGLHAWLDSAASLGADTLYLGPVFESSAHGYDTADYYTLDRRLGTNADLAAFSEAVHQRGMRLMLDGVFHHVGRDFWAFRDVLAAPDSSRYRDWFFLDPRRRSPYGDPFAYEGWHGHYDLVKLNVHHPEVKAHLFDAVRSWLRDFAVDGLRLDAADVLDLDFQRELATLTRALRPDFCLLGEVIHGDYERWVGKDRLDGVTNYQLYKGLYSSHNDRNYFELAHTLTRQFARGGSAEGLPLCNFADNHDVDRIASRLRDPVDLYPLHILLFGMPGVPSIYYGSEWGIEGKKDAGDEPLRPALNPTTAANRGAHPALRDTIQKLARIRQSQSALRTGAYRELKVASQQFAFERYDRDQRIIIAVNAAESPIELDLTLPEAPSGQLLDILDDGRSFPVQSGKTRLALPPHWGRILRCSTP